jgi:hypothetical protein
MRSMTSEAPKLSDSPGSAPPDPTTDATGVSETPTPKPAPREFGGPQGLEPTRYGDWEKNGRCIDF